MAKQFYVWKDPACNGIDPEWLELTGVEFYRLIKAPENKGRFFVKLGDDGNKEAGTIIMEATEKVFKDWRREQRAATRRRKDNEGVKVTLVPLDTPITADEECLLSDTIVDEEDFVETFLLNEDIFALHKVLDTLTPDEMNIINALFLENYPMLSEREIAISLGIPQRSLNNRKQRIFAKIKKSLAQNRKPLAN